MNKRKIAKFLKSAISSQVIAILLSILIVLLIIQMGWVGGSLSDLIKLNLVLSVGIVSVVTYLVGFVDKAIEKRIEERLKLNDNYDEILKIYPEETPFQVEERVYPLCEVMNENDQFTIKLDSHEFTLDPRIVSNMTCIMNAHKSSRFKNKPIYRVNNLTKISNHHFQLEISESDQYNTLFTNKAMDASIVKHLSIRDMFEYGPKIHEFKNTKMCNGVGLNALARSKDGYYFLVKRTDKNPTGKNMPGPCSSMLYDLYKEQLEQKPLVNSEAFNESLISQSIYRGVAGKLGIFDKKHYTLGAITQKDYQFLGLVRNLIEGGKPELCYLYQSNLSKDQIVEQYHKQERKKIKSEGANGLIFFHKEELTWFPKGKIAIGRHKYELSAVTAYLIEKAFQIDKENA